MSISKRQEHILELLNEHGFLTVDKLSNLTYTSPSSIRRDLVRLQNLSMIKRTRGGASIFHTGNQSIPLNSRMTKNIAEKRKIARLAARFLHDGQSVILDGSSSAGFMIPYIAKFKDMLVFTNNMYTAINAINYGITTYCIGGFSVNQSAVLSGPQAYRSIAEISPDIFFFSSQNLSKSGDISDSISEENHIRSLMLERAKFSVFLCDSEKFGGEALYRLTSVDNIDVCVFDRPYDELKAKCDVIVPSSPEKT